jgi:hypothetical protein
MITTPHRVADDPGTTWVKDEAPVIEPPPDDAGTQHPAPAGRWSPTALRSGVYGVVTPNVVDFDGGYRMYYTQILPRPGNPAGANDYDNSTTRILSATSADGEIWLPESGVRLSAYDGGAGAYRVVSPEVVPMDESGSLRMYYECCVGPSQPSSIRSAVSTDGGLSWAVELGVCVDGTDSYNAPRVLPLADGRWRLYCGARGVGIISAISQDGGRTFQREPGLRLAASLSYEALTLFAPEVLRIADAGYRMYYAGYSAANRAYVLSAVSEDGLLWYKEPTPVVAPGGRWDRAKCSEMCVMSLPQSTGLARYRMMYEACDGTADDERGVWRIASATSSAEDPRSSSIVHPQDNM